MDKRESFVLYSNIKDVLDALSDEQSGKLFRAIVDYNNGLEPQLTDPVLKMAFIPIRQGLDSNNKAWEETKKARSEAGKKGMEKRWGNKDNKDNNVITDNNKDNTVIDDKPKRKKKPEEPKQAYGKRGNVKLTEAEYNRLCDEYGKELTEESIEYLDWYIPDKHYKSKDHNRAIRKWVIDAVLEDRERLAKRNQMLNKPQTTATTTNINDYIMQQAMGADYGQSGRF